MLDLDPRVHLEEEVLALTREKTLDRARRAIADGARGLDRDPADLCPERVVDRRRRRLFDELLMAALDRAIALAEVDDPVVAVGEHLYLDVAWILQVPLDIDDGVGEVRLPFAPGRLERAVDLVG